MVKNGFLKVIICFIILLNLFKTARAFLARLAWVFAPRSLMDGPFNSILYALYISLSMIASASVGSPIYSYHLSMGSWLAIILDFFLYRSSSICNRANLVSDFSGCSPKSSRINNAFLSNLLRCLTYVPSIFDAHNRLPIEIVKLIQLR